jgi:chemotaxis protein CheC
VRQPGGPELGELEMDALREAGNLGSGRAATALSTLLGGPVSMDVPRAEIVDLAELAERLGSPEEMAAAVYFEVRGASPGRIVLLMDEGSVGHVLRRILGPAPEQDAAGGALSPGARSTLKEVGNIVCGSYVSSLAEWVGLTLTISVPALAFDMAACLIQSVAAEAAEDVGTALLLESRFRFDGQAVAIRLLFLPEAGSLEVLLSGMAKSTGVDPRGRRG